MSETVPSIAIFERLSRLEQFAEDLAHELLGNGQPGRVQRLEDAITDVRRDVHALTDGLRTARRVARVVFRYVSPPGLLVLAWRIGHALGVF